jgi:hypothetical protein
MSMNAQELDPRALPLDELRSLRAELQHEDDVVSYVRRMAQARLDLVRAEQRRRTEEGEHELADELPVILSSHMAGGSGGAPRPPRPADDFSGHPLAAELDGLCDSASSADLGEFGDEDLAAFYDALHEFETARSNQRRDLFVRIDALSAELVRRYRDGEADVDGLLADD